MTRTRDQDSKPSPVAPLLSAIAIFLLTFVAYLPAMRGQFIWDDDRHVSENRALRSPDGLRDIWLKLKTTPQYYPLTHTTFWMEYHLWSTDPRGYHVVNVVLHSVNALLLWRLLAMLRVPGACAAALIFALHPIQVESVAWISERKNVLSMCLMLSSLIAYWRWITERQPRRYFISLIAFLAALFSKTVVCSMPAVVLVLLWWNRRLAFREIAPLLPFFVIGILAACLTGTMERDHVGASGPEWDLSVTQRILIAARATWFYAATLLWPMKLTFSYPRWTVDPHTLWQWAFPLSLAVVFVSLVALRRRIGRAPLAAALIFCGVLVPALGFVNTFPMRYSFVADHFQYVAGAALTALIAAMLTRIARFVPVVVALVLMTLTFSQAGIYVGPESIWRDTIAKNPSSWMAHYNLAVLLSRDAQVNGARADESLALFARTEALRPEHEHLHFSWGNALLQAGRNTEAIEHYDRYVAQTTASDRSRRSIALALLNSGKAWAAEGLLTDARSSFDHAIAVDPTLAEPYLQLARLEEGGGRDDRAIERYLEYLARVPVDAETIAWLGYVYGRANRFDDASAAFRRALAIDPNSEPAKRGLAMADEMQKHPPATTRSGIEP